MTLRKLTLKNFRVFSDIEIHFNDGINIITGMNGQGKSSILESIYYLALTRSFRTNSDKNAIQYDRQNFDISGIFFSSLDKELKVRLYYSEFEGKNLFLKDKRVNYFSQFIGTIPCVILTLDDTKLVIGSPSERRKFIDILLAQISPMYVEDLKKYKRILFQRNALFNNPDLRVIKDQVSVWNRQLIDVGSAIILRRLAFVSFLNEHLSSYYHALSNIKAVVLSRYAPSLGTLEDDDSIDTIKAVFERSLERVYPRELEKRTTLIGPHRDEILFFYNDRTFKAYCSQGEIKTLLIALKLLEWEYMRNQRHIQPILLLDDIFGELDLSRMRGLLTFIKNVGQAYITTTLPEKLELSEVDTVFQVKDKKVYHA
jgi:DNA replication and repair protein RecF